MQTNIRENLKDFLLLAFGEIEISLDKEIEGKNVIAGKLEIGTVFMPGNVILSLRPDIKSSKKCLYLSQCRNMGSESSFDGHVTSL